MILPFQNAAGVTIDYTMYNIVYTPDIEYGGLRIRKGDGKLVVRWEKLLRVDVSKVTSDGAEGQIVTVAGDKQPVVLLLWSKKGPYGEY